MHGISKPYLRASYHVYKIGCLLVRGISLPVVQLFVIDIENILRGEGGNVTSVNTQHSQHFGSVSRIPVTL